jgi:hypothetical protein
LDNITTTCTLHIISLALRCFTFLMAETAEEPSPLSFELHARWVDDLVGSPTTRGTERRSSSSLLTVEDASEHVLRGSKSFAARSWKSRQSANSLRVPSNKENRSTTASDTDRSLPGPTKVGGVLGEIAPNNQAIRSGPWRQRPSPTPSLRKKKIESLVKAHGSPTHVRVTAGGRIVPSEQSPLCHPRYGYSAIKTNGGLIKFAPNNPAGKTQWTQATQNGFVAQDIEGRLCQIVDGVVMPLTEINGALQLYMPAPNLNITQRGPSAGPSTSVPPAPGPQHQQRQASQVVAPEPSPAAQMSALELEYSKLDHELKELNKTEVLHGKTMGKVAKDALFGKRRELIINMDNVRKALKSLKDQAAAAPAAPPAPAPQPAVGPKQSISPPKNRLPAFLQQRQTNQQAPPIPPAPAPAVFGHFFGPIQPQPYPTPYGFQTTPSPEAPYDPQPWAMPPAAVFVPPPHPFDGSMSSTSLPLAAQPPCAGPPTEQPAQHATVQRPGPPAPEPGLPQNDGALSVADNAKVSPPRQSHALPIKAPEPKGLKSSLNPMSPVYKPGQGLSPPGSTERPAAPKSVKDRAPTPLSPFLQLATTTADSHKVSTGTNETVSPVKKSLVQSSSISSFETADFFPRNTREYSTRKHEYPDPSDPSEDKENADPQRRDSKLEEQSRTPAKLSQVSHGHPVIVHSNYEAASPQQKAPIAPPGTPVNADATTNQHSLPLRMQTDE